MVPLLFDVHIDTEMFFLIRNQNWRKRISVTWLTSFDKIRLTTYRNTALQLVIKHISGEIKLSGQTSEGRYFICSFLLLQFLPVTSYALSRTIYFLQIANKIFTLTRSGRHVTA